MCPLYISGKWREIVGKTGSPVYNPSRGSVIASVPMCGPEEVNEAVASAKAAFPAWRDTPPNEQTPSLLRP